MTRYFSRVDWLVLGRDDEDNKIVSVQFALVQEEAGEIETAAIFDFAYDERHEDGGLIWESAQLCIKSESIGLEGIKLAVVAGEGLEPQELTGILCLWDNLHKLCEHWEKGTYAIEYWEYCKDHSSAKIKRRESNLKMALDAIGLRRKIYDALDAAGYHLDVAELPTKYHLRLRARPETGFS